MILNIYGLFMPAIFLKDNVIVMYYFPQSIPHFTLVIIFIAQVCCVLYCKGFCTRYIALCEL